MNTLFEDPLPILVMGVILTAALSVGFIKTGHRGLLAATAAVVLIVIGLLALEHFVVTDREEVEETLYTIAEAIERNDIDAALRYVSPKAPGVEHANRELRRIHFQTVDIKSNLEIDIAPDRDPPTAETRFNVVVAADPGYGMGRYPRFVRATWVKEGDRWLVRDYEHYDPTRGMRRDPAD